MQTLRLEDGVMHLQQRQLKVTTGFRHNYLAEGLVLIGIIVDTVALCIRRQQKVIVKSFKPYLKWGPMS